MKSSLTENWLCGGMAKPSVSVILPAWHSHETLAACLHSLRAQSFRDFEVIVVDSSPGSESAAIVAGQFPEVRLHRSEQRLWPHAARNLGTRFAQGDILVFSDPDCRMSPGWLEHLVRKQREGRHLVGGGVAGLNGGWFENGVHISKYAWWLPGGNAGPRPDLPSANVSYSRSLFEEVGPFREEWCGDTLLAQRAAQRGIEPWFEPAASIQHDHRVNWTQFLRERFERGLDYGRIRPQLQGWSRWRTLAYLVATPLIVLWMTARAVKYAALSSHLALMLWCLPVVAAGYSARQLGEAFAYGRLAWRKP